MRKMKILILVMSLSVGQLSRADEGMWLLPLIEQLNINKMQEMGLKLSAEDIYSINQNSLKDAIVIFGGGCTGEMISDQGLLLTNHHCGYGKIQELSSVEHNYLKDGFWATSMDQELPAPGLSVTFMKYMKDVTNDVLANVADDMPEDERQKEITAVIRHLVKEAKEGNHYQAQVKSYFSGNQYFLIVTEKFEDVRFVGAPPSSIGKFGYDTDNWMWPRHTGDFSLFRVYCGPDGKPAKYAKNNKPYKPAHHLPISLKGVELNDFAMTLGYPGSTDRYQSSWGIDERMNIINEAYIKVRGIKQDIWGDDMLASEKVRIQYASKFSRSSNYWKNSIGMNKGLNNLDVPAKKKALEAEFDKWINASEDRKVKYGEVLHGLETAYTNQAPFVKANYYLSECLLRGTEAFTFSLTAGGLELALEGGNKESIASATELLQIAGDKFFKDYYPETDRKVMAAMLELYRQDISSEYHPEIYNIIEKKYKGNTEAFANDMFKKSVFTSKERFEAFLKKPKLKSLQKDLIFQGGQSIYEVYSKLGKLREESSTSIQKYSRLFEAGLMEMQNDRTFYPDANFSMRLSYGKVGGYKARDAVYYKHYTTLKGIIEKEDPTNFEFEVPAKLKELYEAKDFGPYADPKGYMPVCFTSDNDITGGNSGSPVINANGELFGLAFDGNWEAMSGDIAFETELQKCINVDIRYVLFIIDKYAGATNLIEEMTLVK
jgi:hypothetical protein